MKQISIALVEDHKMVRQMWATLFEARPEIVITGESSSFSEAIDMVSAKPPDIILLDINLPDASGLDAVPRILEVAPAARIIAVSMHNQPAYARKMIALGAKSYVTKNSPPEEIFVAIDTVMNGETYVCDEIRDML